MEQSQWRRGGPSSSNKSTNNATTPSSPQPQQQQKPTTSMQNQESGSGAKKNGFNSTQVSAYLNNEYQNLLKKSFANNDSVLVYAASDKGWASSQSSRNNAPGKTSKGQSFVNEVKKGLDLLQS